MNLLIGVAPTYPTRVDDFNWTDGTAFWDSNFERPVLWQVRDGDAGYLYFEGPDKNWHFFREATDDDKRRINQAFLTNTKLYLPA